MQQKWVLAKWQLCPRFVMHINPVFLCSNQCYIKYNKLCLKKHPRHFRLKLENQLSDFDNFWRIEFWFTTKLPPIFSLGVTKLRKPGLGRATGCPLQCVIDYRPTLCSLKIIQFELQSVRQSAQEANMMVMMTLLFRPEQVRGAGWGAG